MPSSARTLASRIHPPKIAAAEKRSVEAASQLKARHEAEAQALRQQLAQQQEQLAEREAAMQKANDAYKGQSRRLQEELAAQQSAADDKLTALTFRQQQVGWGSGGVVILEP